MLRLASGIICLWKLDFKGWNVDIYRRLLRIPWVDHVSNVQVPSWMPFSTELLQSKKRIVNYFGHVMRGTIKRGKLKKEDGWAENNCDDCCITDSSNEQKRIPTSNLKHFINVFWRKIIWLITSFKNSGVERKKKCDGCQCLPVFQHPYNPSFLLNNINITFIFYKN